MGKFRKNDNYNEDYEDDRKFSKSKKPKNEHAEARKVKARYFDEVCRSYNREDKYRQG
jgi:hypothetical protein